MVGQGPGGFLMAFSVYDTQSKKVRSVYFLLDDPKGGKLSSEKFEKWDSSSQSGECIYYYLAHGKPDWDCKLFEFFQKNSLA